MNNRISKDKRATILLALSEGVAINSICRMTQTGKNAVLRFIKEAGEACEDWHNRNFRDLCIPELQLDEQWSYVWAHKDRLSHAQKQSNAALGDCWLWAAIDPVTKAIISWRSGKRTMMEAQDFADDLASRVKGDVQITTDALTAYTFAIPGAFGDRAHFAQEAKVFAKDLSDPAKWQRYAVNPLAHTERRVVTGMPDLDRATTSHIERFFLTNRQQNRRFARKTLGYSKRWDNHALSASLHIFIYNMCRKHETLKVTPAQALGVTDERWTTRDVVDMVEQYSKRVEEDQFEAAFSTYDWNPPTRRTYEPQTPKTPWYLDPESGGPNPEIKKPGIAYEDDATLT